MIKIVNIRQAIYAKREERDLINKCPWTNQMRASSGFQEGDLATSEMLVRREIKSV